MDALERYYNKFNEDHRLTTRHGRVEFEVTMDFIHKFTASLSNSPTATEAPPSPLKILDIGAGTGRYSIALAHEGFDVTAVEPVKRNLEILRGKHENVKTWGGDARSLHFLEDRSFDITLMFGPLYHLHGDEQKLRALAEARRVTKKNGIILAAYVMDDYSVISYCFKEHHLKESIEKGGLAEDFHTICTEDDLYDYVRLADIDRLNRLAGLHRIEIISADGPADYMRRELNQMTEEEFRAFIEYQKANCRRSELVGAGSHTVDALSQE